MLQNLSANKITIFIILVLINLIKCQNDYNIDENQSIIDGASSSSSSSSSSIINSNTNSDLIINDNPSTNIYTLDLLQHELQQHYDEIERKLVLSQTSSSLLQNESKEINNSNKYLDETTEFDIQQISLSSLSSSYTTNDQYLVNNSTPKSLTTLIPDYVANSGGGGGGGDGVNYIQPITISSLNLTNEFTINDSSIIIDNDNITDNINNFESSSQHDDHQISFDIINDENDSTSGVDEIMAFDMKKNVLYTEDLNNNDIKMRNLTELETINNNNNDDDTEQSEFIDRYINNDTDNIESTILTGDIDEPEMLIGTTTIMTPIQLPPLIINRIKQGKQIQIERKRLLKKFPHERLQQYIEDPYIRKPLAAIVDPAINSLDKTISLWKNALRPNTALDIILLGINATGVSVIYNFTNTRTFLAGLNSLKESEPANPFFGILKATELIPYDSAIFLSAATTPEDTMLGQHAGIALLKKRIRLYLVWYGDQKYNNNSNEPNETGVTGGILGKIAVRSGGEIFHMRNDSDGLHELEENMITLVSDNYRGAQEIEIPVDTTISDLQIKIDTMMRTATLQTPTGG